MMIRFAALALLLLAPGPAAAAQAEPQPADEAARPEVVRVGLETSAGPILLEIETGRAPVTAANFLRYVDEKRFEGAAIYRAVNVAPGYGLIQGGVRNDPERVLLPIAHEPTSETGITHVDGTISMARAEPGTANGDFFITIGTMPSMDADPARAGDPLGYAAFGRVVDGMDVVRQILVAPTSPTEGEGVMKGQMLAPPIRIIAARRVE